MSTILSYEKSPEGRFLVGELDKICRYAIMCVQEGKTERGEENPARIHGEEGHA